MTKLPNKFPSIYRFITESKIFKAVEKWAFRLLNQSKRNKWVICATIAIILCLIIMLLASTILSLTFLYFNLNKFIALQNQRQKLISELNFWRSIEDQYPGYKDAYLQMAEIEYRLSDFDKARQYNSKVLLLDPNDEKAKELGKYLN